MDRLLRCGFPGDAAAAAAGAASSAATAGGGVGGLRPAGAKAGPDPVRRCMGKLADVMMAQSTLHRQQ
jgi:hypothetical protein